MSEIRRREFIAGLGAAAWPRTVWAQETATPVLGWIGLSPLEISHVQQDAVHRGLAQSGFIVGRNLVFEYHAAARHLGVSLHILRRRALA